MMEQKEVLQTLSDHKQELSAKYGVTRLGIFGSVARDESTRASDVDVVVEMPPDLFKMVHMKEDLEAILATPVDLIRYSRFLNTYLKRRIDDEAIYV
ncbi:MAG: nucleotidyltransferase family protein [Anaerolineae bacterium]|nr:nucleotidyltransferase family protein [Anaerolineae bacterium]